MEDTLERRIEALERAITEGEHDLAALTEEADALERLDELDSTVDQLEETVTELEAATQALRGYVGNVRSVNRDVEQRADTALAKVEKLESAAGAGQSGRGPGRDDKTDNREIHEQRRVSGDTQSHRTDPRSDTRDTGTTGLTAPPTGRGKDERRRQATVETTCHHCGRPPEDDRNHAVSDEGSEPTGAALSIDGLADDDSVPEPSEQESDGTPLDRIRELV